MDNTTLKAALRKRIFALRAQDRRAFNVDLSDQITACVRAFESTQGRKPIIAGYCAIRSELDVMPALELLRSQGYRCCLPYITQAQQRLRFLAYDGELIDGEFGAKTPPTMAEQLDPDVLLLPLVGWDQCGNRLGYGGGFYDRSLEYLRALKPCLAVGIAYDCQERPRLPIEQTDQRLDRLITPSRLFDWRAFD